MLNTLTTNQLVLTTHYTLYLITSMITMLNGTRIEEHLVRHLSRTQRLQPANPISKVISAARSATRGGGFAHPREPRGVLRDRDHSRENHLR